MRFKTALLPFLSLIFVSGLVFIQSCHKHDALTTDNTASLATITKAKQYFESNVLPTQLSADTLASQPWAVLHKTPIWKMAYSAPLKQGSADTLVIVPVSFKENLYLKRNGGKLSLSAGLLTYLLMYPDEKGGYHTEVATEIPDDSYVTDQTTTKSYTGMIRVQDWLGNFIKGFHYKNGVVNKYYGSSSTGYSQTNVKTPSTLEWDCTTTDWYNCFSLDGGANYTCNFVNETEDCVASSGSFGTGTIYQIVYKYLPNSGGGDWVGNPYWQICSNFGFSTDNSGNYIVNLNNLQESWKSSTLGIVSFSFPVTCVKIPSSGISQLTASEDFSTAYNNSVAQLASELDNSKTAPANAMSRFISLVQQKFAVYGGTWDPYENCDQSAITVSNSQCQP